MFYLIDKPLLMSSFDVIRQLRKVLNTKKMWHTGTLDPLASGLLLIATRNSTKLIPELTFAKKRYTFTVRLDGETDSLDLGTPVRSVDTSHYTDRSPDELQQFLLQQTAQIPPRYSALHVDGKRAYERVREGEVFTLEERSIVIEDVEVIDLELPRSVSLSLTISSWWYIRSLACVIAWFFGITGGYISELRRTHIYLWESLSLDVSSAHPIETPCEISYSKLFPTIHTIDITAEQYADILNGKCIYPTGTSSNAVWKYFLDFSGKYRSLCTFDGEKYTIIRNNV